MWRANEMHKFFLTLQTWPCIRQVCVWGGGGGARWCSNLLSDQPTSHSLGPILCIFYRIVSTEGERERERAAVSSKLNAGEAIVRWLQYGTLPPQELAAAWVLHARHCCYTVSSLRLGTLYWRERIFAVMKSTVHKTIHVEHSFWFSCLFGY
jgi:hypothetical protein